jgi:hypothetical protein
VYGLGDWREAPREAGEKQTICVGRRDFRACAGTQNRECAGYFAGIAERIVISPQNNPLICAPGLFNFTPQVRVVAPNRRRESHIADGISVAMFRAQSISPYATAVTPKAVMRDVRND